MLQATKMANKNVYGMLCIVLLSSLPLIVCDIAKSSDDKDIVHTNLKISEDLPEELFAAYRESYITKDAAKKFSKNIRSHKKPLDDKDYEDLLQEIVVIPSEKVGNKMYEKRYFDYQPAERTDVEMSNEELDMFDEIDSQQDILVESLKNKEKRKARVNNRRLRRNANPTTENGQNLKRSAGSFYSHQLLSAERNHPHNPRNPRYTALNNNPWQSITYYKKPFLNNYYLPVAPAQDYMKPFYHNVPQPPVNPAQVPQIIPATDSRFGNDNDNDRFIFDVFDQTPMRPNTVTQSPVKRPLPSLIHNSVQDRPNAVPTATRRPLPSILHESVSEASRNPSGKVNTRPASPPVTQFNDVLEQTTRRPIIGPPYRPPTTEKPEEEGPSKCVWGIINCCTRNNLAIRYQCFEQIGCSGAFWDFNPCSDNILDAAFEESNRYID